ncbi:hypothetical protein T492DRAFT_868057 [Pavlovales sp. CCMP2436]|nr:hypothetical protein T492DRAFT_868057 [Pavlovales sp. CCMP2436]
MTSSRFAPAVTFTPIAGLEKVLGSAAGALAVLISTWLERRGGAARGRCRTNADLAFGGVEETGVTAGFAASPA